jgi:ABC-type lipoprotein release transport system permease subunit
VFDVGGLAGGTDLTPFFTRRIGLHGDEVTGGEVAIAIGLANGAVGAALIIRVMSSFLLGTSAVEPVLIAAAAATLGVAAAVATYIPARRAIHGDPIAALRAEK